MKHFGFIPIAAIFVALSALLHLGAFLGAGFSNLAVMFIGVGVLYAGLARFLWRGWRWFAWVSYFVMLLGLVFVMASFGASSIPDGILKGIALADGCAAVLLFVGLWRGPKRARLLAR